MHIKITERRNYRYNVDDGDEVLEALQIEQTDHLMILTSKGKGLRLILINLETGRVTRGVRGIKLKEKDQVVNL